MTDQKKKPFSVADAAGYLGVTPGFLYKLTSAGKISFYKPNGGKLYFTQDDLDAYLFRGRRAADFELEEKANRFAARGRK